MLRSTIVRTCPNLPGRACFCTPISPHLKSNSLHLKSTFHLKSTSCTLFSPTSSPPCFPLPPPPLALSYLLPPPPPCSPLASSPKKGRTNSQFGFRKSHSTTTSLLKSTNKWLLNIDKGLINGVLFLGLRKTFRTVDLKILIDKLKLYGITGSTLNWFISCLDKNIKHVK